MSLQQCARCGFLNVATDVNCYKCRVPLNRASDQGWGSVWRKNSVLVMTRHSLLPDRCVKCNEPAERKLKRKLSWHHPALYFLILGGALFYILLAVFLRKTAIVEVGLCENHSAIRRRDIIITWVLGLFSVFSFFLASQLADLTFVGIGSVLVLITGIYGAVRIPVVSPTKIDDNFVWLKGFGTSYLAELPEWRSLI